MQEMGSMPAIRRQSSIRFLLCPDCGKAERVVSEGLSSPGAGKLSEPPRG
jgi:hypothetical protein